jgi:hypothetical protein
VALRDSRAAERDIVKVTKGNARLFISENLGEVVKPSVKSLTLTGDYHEMVVLLPVNARTPSSIESIFKRGGWL